MHSPEAIRIEKERLRLLERKIELQEGLPFLHGWKWYSWAKDFFDSTNKVNLLCAANQISKSSTQIRKAIDWATDKSKWPSLWNHTPTQFWYFYPSFKVATVEFEKKWKQFLPAGKYKKDPVYGWREEYNNKEISAVHFNTGVSIYFHTYTQKSSDLQTATVDAIFCDEEMPEVLYDELMLRLSASDGYFHMVFTATLGQEFWRLALEPTEHEKENLPQAWKRCVSMFDCQEYIDGTKSHWTTEKIQMVIARCKNHKEVLKRVYGRFVRDDSGLKYEQFDVKKNMRPAPGPVPADWIIYSGVDIGSGGTKNHPGAIAFVAVRPDYRAGRVFLTWRGDDQETTAGDIMNKFRELRDTYKLNVIEQYYDWGSKDFETIATRIGEPFIKADKSHERGEDIINTLFKNLMLTIDDNPENHKLAGELIGLRKEQSKNKAKDDLVDAMRYAITSIPWDFTAITPEIVAQIAALMQKPDEPELTPMQKETQARREFVTGEHHEESSEVSSIEEEFSEWNYMYSGE